MSVNLRLHNDPPSLREDGAGMILVVSSRVCLDTVIAEYENGITPEEIVQEYDTLNLADVHAVIAYYLRHRDEVRDYLRQREKEADSLRNEVNTQQALFPTKEELIERQRKKHAQTGK